MNRIYEKRIVPAATIKEVDDALPLAEALLEAGLPIIEVTFRTPCAGDAIRKIASKLPEMLVGAGTVLDRDQLMRAFDAGAQFAVAPGLNEELVIAAQDAGRLFAPGILTPTEVDRAIRMGCRLLKFFPAPRRCCYRKWRHWFCRGGNGQLHTLDSDLKFDKKAAAVPRFFYGCG